MWIFVAFIQTFCDFAVCHAPFVHRGSLTVQSEVLGERLGTEHLKTQGNKVAQRPGISLQITWGESLISRVKERKQLPPLGENRTKEQRVIVLWWTLCMQNSCPVWNDTFASGDNWDNSTGTLYMFACTLCAYYHHNFSNPLPLLLGRVSASRIMSTGMQDKDRMLWTTLWETVTRRKQCKIQKTKIKQEVNSTLSHSAYFQVTKETSQIKASFLCVPVLVRTDILKASVAEYSVVIFWDKQ